MRIGERNPGAPCGATMSMVLLACACAITGCSKKSGAGGVNDAGAGGRAGDGAVESPVSDANGQRDAGAADSADVAEEVAPPVTCSPATLLDPRPFEECAYGQCRCRTYAPDAGSLTLDETGQYRIMGITSLQLVDPMQAGMPYSLSVSVSNAGFYGSIEFWGTTSECGPGLQMLYSAALDSRVYCADVLPTRDYTYVLFVERLQVDGGAPASEHADTILACPTGRCPPPP